MKKEKMNRKIHSSGFLACLLFLTASLSSCTFCSDHDYTYKTLSQNTRWAADDGSFVINVEGNSVGMGYGTIAIDGEKELINATFGNGSSTLMGVDFQDERMLFFTFTWERGDDPKLVITTDENRTGDSAWDNVTKKLNRSYFSVSDLDAKYFFGSDFKCSELGAEYTFDYEKSPFTFTLFGTYDDTDLTFQFGENSSFSIVDDKGKTASGTYETKECGMDLTFAEDEIYSSVLGQTYYFEAFY